MILKQVTDTVGYSVSQSCFVIHKILGGKNRHLYQFRMSNILCDALLTALFAGVYSCHIFQNAQMPILHLVFYRPMHLNYCISVPCTMP